MARIRGGKATLLLLVLVCLGIAVPASARGGERDRSVASSLQRMTLEQKVGQLFMVQVYGRTPADVRFADQNLSTRRGARGFAAAIKRYHLGGVIYFNYNGNISVPLDPTQVQELSNGLQRIARRQRGRVPLLIATDQEGGLVARVTEPATVFPGAMALGATRSTALAEAAARVGAAELAALGINVDFAPVVDVNLAPANPVIGVRSFGEKPRLVAQLGAAQVRGYQRGGVVSTAKHFPGHGDTAIDSHYGLPIITHSRRTLERVDLLPFRAAIRAGVDSIMTAHIVVPALDRSGLPATLSRPILTGLLRKQLRFRGVIVTDSLDMSGANVMPRERVAVQAVKAGADILLNPPDVPLAYRAVLSAVRRGEISRRRLDSSVGRILQMKRRRGLFDRVAVRRRALRVLGGPQHQQVASTIARRSITLLKNENGGLPVPSGARVLVAGPVGARPDLLATELRNSGVQADAHITSSAPTDGEIATAVAAAPAAQLLVVTTANATASQPQQRLVQALQAVGRPVVVAAMRNPYDFVAFPGVDGYLAAYGARPVTIRALARVITGELQPRGRLPVTIPGHFRYGAGLTYHPAASAPRR